MPVAFARRLLRPFVGAWVAPLTAAWAPYSRLLPVGDRHGWVIAEEMRQLARIARRLGARTAPGAFAAFAERQSIFFGSHFDLLACGWLRPSHRIATAYFHGRPGTGVPEFDAAYEQLRRHHHRIDRIQVSHREALAFVRESGIAPEKVFLIPIGIDLRLFPMRTPESRRRTRERYGIPEHAVVVGSFQKDGSGWDEGMLPKLVKGPDLLLEVLARLHQRVPNLLVLLTGPARGFVKAGLTRLGVPFRHHYARSYAEVARLFHALDLYLITARQEGGPKAVLEAMAAGVPLVTTRVGQAADLVRHTENGWMVDVGDTEGLTGWCERVIEDAGALGPVLAAGRATAEANAYERQDPLWRALFEGFVALPGGDSAARPVAPFVRGAP